eukprot:gene20360-27124_t
MMLCPVFSLAILCFVTLASALNYVYDETLWTKQFWKNDWKLENPMIYLNPTNEPPKSNIAGIADTWANSLDGPNARRDLRNIDKEFGSVLDFDSVEDPTLVSPAAEAVQCNVCHVLISKAWQSAVMSVLRGTATDAGQILKQMEQSCENTVVTSTLAKFAIFKTVYQENGSDLTDVIVDHLKVNNFFCVLAFLGLRVTLTVLQRHGLLGADKHATEGKDDVQADDTKHHRASASSSSQQHLSRADQQTGAQHTYTTSPHSEHPAHLAAAHYSITAASTRHSPAAPVGTISTIAAPQHTRSTSSTSRTRRTSTRQHLAPPVATILSASTPAARNGEENSIPEDSVVMVINVDEVGGENSISEDSAVTEINVEEVMNGIRAEQGELSDGELQGLIKHLFKGLEVRPLITHSQCFIDVEEVVNGIRVKQGVLFNEELQGLIKHLFKGLEMKTLVWMFIPSAYNGLTRESARQIPNTCPKQQGGAGGLKRLEWQLVNGAVKNHGCGASGACLTGVAGTAYGQGFVKEPKTPGFVLGRPFYGQPSILQAPVKVGATVDSGKVETEATAADNLDDPSELKKLAAQGKLLRIPAEFFVYEYMYKNHTRQFHEEPSGELTEDYILGTFQRESPVVVSASTGEAAVLQHLDLLPEFKIGMSTKLWPYTQEARSVCWLGESV